MSLSWSLISITDARKAMGEWCAKAGIDLSKATATGRYPNLDEVCSVLNALGTYQANSYSFSGRSVFHAIVSVDSRNDSEAFPDISPGISIENKGNVTVNEPRSSQKWTTHVNVYASDNAEADAEVDIEVPYKLYFKDGDLELNVIIAERLSRICGSFLLFEGSGESYLVPILINPGDTNPQQVIRQWNERFQQYGNALEGWLYGFD